MLWPWLMAFGIPFPLLALQAERNFRALPSLDPACGRFDYPSLSVIIPARDEEDNLQRLLPSLLAQQYPGELETIVVDDGSADRTAELARQHGVQVLAAGPLPAGWLGKPHACHAGVQHSSGTWLLFTDADTCHLPGGLARAVQHAMAHDLDGLSLLLTGQSFGLADRLALMAAFAGLFAGMRPGQPALNGQYILLKRQVYEDCGGFEAVKNEPVEDLALAHRLHGLGFRVPLLRGDAAAEVHMYTGLRQLWLGLARLGSGALKWSGGGGWLTALFITGALLPAPGILFAAALEMPPAWAAAAWLLVAIAFMPWARRSGSWALALLAPVGALTVQTAALSGLVRSLAGSGNEWKGRRV